MRSLADLKYAIAMKAKLIWNDPDPIEGNDYIVSYIEPITDEFDWHTPILIQYNNGDSEAQVFCNEILIINDKD